MMSTEEMIRGNNNESFDNFPIGLRVLAVDDDAVCLKTLGAKLMQCKYSVTTSNNAKEALKLLRENKDGFDVVISDVHMPDMDGFKLLELIGLEMDIPVIMLSINNDRKLVWKGVTHGACDYLVKPVRVEELQNIWQHVIRKKKLPSKSTDEVKDHQSNGEVYESPMTDNADQKRKLNRKRKDDECESEDEEDLATQKKARVVWSIDLHKKFVAAVNQLGIEKAVPKKILDLMNIEGLTRENVASHLQKYRLYLKKISPLATQQGNMRTGMGYDDYRFMRSYSSDWLGSDYRSLSGAGRLGGATLSPYSTTGMLGRLNSNSPATVNLRGVGSSSLMQPTHAQTLSTSAASAALGKMYPTFSSSSQNPFIFQGNSSPLDSNSFQKGIESFNPSGSNISTTPNKTLLNVNAHNVASSFNLEPYNPNATGFSGAIPDRFQLPVEANSSNGTYFANSFPLENITEKAPSDERARSSEIFPTTELPKWHDGYVPHSYDNMDDLMTTMLKRDQEGTSLNADFGFGDCSFGEVL